MTPMNELFTERAINKRHSPGDQTGPVTLLSPPLRFTAIVGILIAIGGGAWAAIAKIPISVSGTGVLVPVSTINTVSASTDGVAIWMFNRPEQAWHTTANRFMRVPESFDDSAMLRLAKEILTQSSIAAGQEDSSVTTTNTSSRAQRHLYKGKNISRDRLIMWIQSSSQHERLQSSIDELKLVLNNTSLQEDNILAKQSILEKELSKRASYLESMTRLADKGFVSRSTILQEQAEADGLRSQLLANNNELLALKSQRSEAYQKVRGELSKLVSREIIFSPKETYIAQIVPNDGETVNQGQPLLSLSTHKLDEPDYVPLYLSNKEMSQVFPGMEILATPSGYKRSEVGGILGTVIAVERLPSSSADIAARVGSTATAELVLKKEQTPSLAIVRFVRDSSSRTNNTGGYKWSSKSTLPFPPTIGDRLDIEVTTRYVHPIQLILPTLKNFLGITPPQTPAGSQENS